jgi:hypothetical protein
MARPSASESPEWPANPLEAANAAFAWLVAGDRPVTVDGCVFEHLPDREIPVDELRALLLRRSCPRRVWDQVWQHVITRSRGEGETWTLVALGLAVPMLVPTASRLTRRFASSPADIHGEVLEGFLSALATIDLAAPRIANRLRWAAYRAGHQALTAALDAPTPAEPGSAPAIPRPPTGHPDLVLARAVEAGVLNPTESAVISQTRLGRTRLHDWATRHQTSPWGAYKTRRRAEYRLATWLTEPAADSADRDPTAETATTQSAPVGRRPRPSKPAKRADGLTHPARNSGLQGQR